MNTADFTEEIAEAEQPLDLEVETMAQEPVSLEETGLLDETLLPESGDYSAVEEGVAAPQETEPAIEEVRLGQADSIDEIGLETLEPETEELSLVVEEGVLPMTPPPEDTSYLEVGPLGLGGAPLGDEPLVEPDLSDFDLEPEEQEPRLEIDAGVPPLASAELDSSAEELTLGIEAGPGYAAEESVVDAEFRSRSPRSKSPITRR